MVRQLEEREHKGTYRNDVAAFMRFAGIKRPKELRAVTTRSRDRLEAAPA